MLCICVLKSDVRARQWPCMCKCRCTAAVSASRHQIMVVPHQQPPPREHAMQWVSLGCSFTEGFSQGIFTWAMCVPGVISLINSWQVGRSPAGALCSRAVLEAGGLGAGGARELALQWPCCFNAVPMCSPHPTPCAMQSGGAANQPRSELLQHSAQGFCGCGAACPAGAPVSDIVEMRERAFLWIPSLGFLVGAWLGVWLIHRVGRYAPRLRGGGGLVSIECACGM